jgi:uncharacterized protein
LSDFAGVVDPRSRKEIESYLARVEQGTKAQVAVVTLKTLEGEPLEDVANDLYHRWGIGQKGKDNGVLLLLVTQDRRMRLEVGRGLEEFIPDGFAGGILRQITPPLRSNDYGNAMMRASQILGDRIAQSQGVTIPGMIVRRSRPAHDSGGGIPWPVIIIGGIFLLMLIRSMSGRSGGGGGGGGFIPGLIIGQLLGAGGRRGGDGWGGGSGGGFGGYDSGGGGFGGFGGGDSGGGGASGNW